MKTERSFLVFLVLDHLDERSCIGFAGQDVDLFTGGKRPFYPNGGCRLGHAHFDQIAKVHLDILALVLFRHPYVLLPLHGQPVGRGLGAEPDPAGGAGAVGRHGGPFIHVKTARPGICRQLALVMRMSRFGGIAQTIAL